MREAPPLEARLLRALRRYLAPELASRVAREVVQEPEPAPLPPPTELERARALRAAQRVGAVTRRVKR